MNTKLKVAAFILVGLQVSCANFGIKTRTQIEQEKRQNSVNQQVETLKKDRANQTARSEDVNQELRNLNGQIDEIRNSMIRSLEQGGESKKDLYAKIDKMELRLKVYEESLARMEDKLAKLQVSKAPTATAKKGIFETGEGFLAKRKYKRAVVEFEKYTKKYPRGRRVALATYYIGVSFHEMKMKNEAKIFYKETVDKWPKSKAAKKAKYRLNTLKK